MKEIETYMMPKEIMEHLQIGKDKVYSLCALKGFPAIKFCSTYKIDKAKYKKWLEEHEGMKITL